MPLSKPQTIENLVAFVQSYNPTADVGLIARAYAFAAEAHGQQTRASGEPYITHPLATAYTLAEMRLAVPIIAAGLLHDVPEDTSKTLEDIQETFGEDIMNMVSGITKLGKIKYRGMERYLENLRKMFLAMAADVRVVFIKFADRLHNLSTLEAIPPKKQYRIALESLEIYAPIANRLGMGEMKGRLEDAAFKYVYPKEYAWVSEMSKSLREDKHAYLERVIRLSGDHLRGAGLKTLEVHGRAKHLYSLYRKLLKNNRDIARIYDIMAVRVIVDSIADCYAALGVIHGHWTPLKGRIKDYIAQPKPNGYRSLHTTVFCEDGEIVEFQIRTREMHTESEYGIAAHWSYDEDKKKYVTGKPTAVPHWVKELAEIQQELSDQKAYLSSLEELKIDMFRDRIFVFTPKGDVIDLPEESTAVDFAYAIHTDIGNTCTAAKVNDEVAPLDRILRNGDMVEIVVDKSRKGPNPDWAHFVKTHHAKSKIRQHAKTSLASWIRGMVRK
jgi:GTP pyrophosphokinase